MGPQEVSLTDVRKEINFCRKVSLPVIGVVENMGDFICPKCHKASTIFPATSGGASNMADSQGVTFLGTLPLDPRIARCCDEGKNFIEELDGTPAVNAFKNIVGKIEDFFYNKTRIG